MKHIFDAQKRFRHTAALSSAKERKEKLKLLLTAFGKHTQAIKNALYLDYRKDAAEVDLTEILSVIQELRLAIGHLDEWLEKKPVAAPLTAIGSSSYLLPEAKGTVLILAPWNFPVILTLSPLISALAAGNTVIIKPSEYTPHINAVLGKMLASVFDPKEVAWIEGDSLVAQALLELPFDHIFFTGSPATGKKIMAAAAKNLTSVTLELGGKSPTIIDETADLQRAADRVTAAKFANSGQICVSPDYILVQESVAQKFTQALQISIERMFGSTDAIRQEEGFTHIVTTDHTRRLQGYLTDAIEKGASVLYGGHIDVERRYVSPTLLSNIKDSMLVAQEEIFGPLLGIITYQTNEEALAYILQREKPLAFYIFSNRKETIQYFVKRVSAGNVLINDAAVHFYNTSIPFGGVNHSGIGKSHGYYGFLEFSHLKGVMHQARRWSLPTLLYPPHSALKLKLTRWILRQLSK